MNSLSAGLVAAVGGLDESLSGLGGISGLLADDSNASLLVGNDTNGLPLSTVSICARLNRLKR